MTRQGFKLVVFDWDGTLIDSTSAIVHSIRKSAEDLGLPVPTREQASHVIGLGLLEAIHMAVPSIRREQLPAYIERYRFHYFQRDPHLEPFEGIPELLDELAGSGAWLAVATGKSRVGLNRALDQMKWGGRFLTTRCADEGAPKPDPWMLRDICEELGLEPAQALMVGDSSNDAQAGHAAGCGVVLVTYGYNHGEPIERSPALVWVASIADIGPALAQSAR